MKKNKLGLFALALGSIGFITCCAQGNLNGNVDGGLKKDTTFLVSLNGTSLSMSDKEIKDSQNYFINSLRNTIGFDFTVVKTLDEINTVEIKANSLYEDVINKMPNVSKVAINQAYRFGQIYGGEQTEAEKEEGFVHLTNGASQQEKATDINHNQSMDSMFVPTSTNKGAGSLVAILDAGFFIEHHAFKDFEPGTIGFTKANERFNYEDLLSKSEKLTASRKNSAKKGEEGSLYHNLKIPFYYDYGGSNLNPSNGYDVYSQTSEHGNHVASITGANGTYEGIAPNCQLALMKVFYQDLPKDKTSPGGTYANDDDILEALNDCVVLGVDALNMSLGSDLDDFADKAASLDVIDKLSASGVSCNISAGNGGKELFKSLNLYKGWATDQTDLGVLGSYANSQSATIVASSTNEEQYYEKALQFGDTIAAYEDQVDYSNGADGITKEKEKLMASLLDQGKDTFDAVLISSPDGNNYGASTDYSYMSGLAEDTNFFKGKIAIVDRGQNSFVDKAQAAQEAGCSALVVINNDPTAIEFTFGMSWGTGNGGFSIPEIPVVFVLQRDREAIIKELKPFNGQQNVKTGQFKLLKETVADNKEKNQLSDFSSEGSTSVMSMGPALSAPGSSIRGAILGKADAQGLVPVDKRDPDKYGYLSGTSMASPNLAGATALMIGEQDFKTEEERRAYIKSVVLRGMSTAQIYSKEVDTIKGIKETVGQKETNNIIINPETHEPEVDENGKPKKETVDVNIYTPTTVDKHKVPYSPRKQGAGVINVSKALSNKVYLEGLKVNKDGTFSDEGLGFAKLELRNNDLIKNGKISLGFRIHNELGDSTTKYKVKLQVMAPQITLYHNHDNENPNYVGKDAPYEGAKIQTPFEQVITEVELPDTITLNGKETQDVKGLTFELSKAQKEALNADFENGTWLEGYVKLEPIGVKDTNNEVTSYLSMPFMGFYGDFDQADAVEPFTFEKEPDFDRTNKDLLDENGNPIGKLYGSDLVNYLAQKSYGLDFANVESLIGAQSYDYYQRNSKKGNILTNVDNISNFAHLPVTKEENGTYTLYAGGRDSDVLYIQQFVYRSIDKADVDLIDKRGNVVLTAPIRDMLTNGRGLYKSHVAGSYIGSGILVHRGYAEMPLYKNGAKIADGTYKLRFTYNLHYGSKQVKEYNLIVDNEASELTSKSIITVGEDKVLRLKFNEIYIPSETRIHVNGDITPAVVKRVSDGYIIDIVLKDAFIDGKLLVSIEDASYNYGTYMINERNVNTGLYIQSDKLTLGSTYSYKVSGGESENLNIDDIYDISVKDYEGKEVDLGLYSAHITYDRKVNSNVVAYGIKEDGTKVRIRDVKLLNNTTVIVTSTFKKINIVDTGIPQDSILTDDNAGVRIAPTENGQVFVDKKSGIKGEAITIYAIANEGYKVGSVKVNGKDCTKDVNGNYQWVLELGENRLEVTFVKE